MDRKYFDEGMNHICSHFAKPHPGKVINSIWDEVKDFSNHAINAASKRVEQEFHPGQLVSIGKIKDIIIIEGKKILGKEALEREREAEEAKRQRGEHRRDNTNYVDRLKADSEFAKERIDLLKLVITPDHDPGEVLKRVAALAKKHPEVTKDEHGREESWEATFKSLHKMYMARGWKAKEAA